MLHWRIEAREAAIPLQFPHLRRLITQNPFVRLLMSETQRALYLYGVTTQPEVIGFLRTQCVLSDEKELEQILNEWRAAAKAFADTPLAPTELPESARTEEIPQSCDSLLAEVRKDPLFCQSFSLLPYSLNLVEIDKIVAGQRYVNLDFVDSLTKQIPVSPTPEFLTKFCLLRRSEAPKPAELQLGHNVYSYRSPSTDFRFLGGYPKPLAEADISASTGGGEPVAALVLLVGYGSPQVNVFKVGGRLILNNGFHRLFALRSKGVTMAPAVVQEISNPDLELPQMIAGLPSQYQVRHPRPSMMRDFLNPAYTREVRMRARDRSVQVQWNVNQVDIPK